MVVRGRSFNLRNSRSRNIAFAFDGGYRDAALWYPVAIAVSILTLGLATPYMAFGRDRYLVSNSRFGEARFRFVDARPGAYYRFYLGALGIGIATAIGVGFLSLVFGAFAGSSPLISVLSSALVVLVVTVYLRVRRANYRWCHTRIALQPSGEERGRTEEIRFELSLSFRTMLWIYASNLVLIAATAGLYAPFARIRAMRYRLSRFFVLGPAAVFAASPEQRVGATGAEAGEAFGFEIAL